MRSCNHMVVRLHNYPWLSSDSALGFAECVPLLLDNTYIIFGEKTNLRLSEGRDACIDG